MSHCDEDDLALISLGEVSNPVDADHLASCAPCRGRLERLIDTVTAARSITGGDRPVTPPDNVWSGILAELGDAGATAEAATDTAATPDSPATVTSISVARGGRGTWLIAVAAGVVGVALGAVVTSGILAPSAGEQVVASAALAPIAESGFAGTATVTRLDDEAVLTISVPGLPAVSDGYYEVWMATPDTATMVAVGTLNPGAETTLALPAGMQVGSFPVVDVSLEHFDGDAGHSATSVVRGLLGD